MRLAVLLVLALPSLAAAQAPGMYDPTPPLAPPGMTPFAADTDEPPSVVTTAPAPPQQSPIELAASRDSADDRAYGTSTALVVPDGKVDASLRFAPIGGLVSVTAGLGGGIEVSADAGGVLGEDGMETYGAGLKLGLVHKGGFALALQASVHEMSDGGDPVDLWSAGAVASTCTDRDCKALLSIGGGMLGSSDSSDSAIPYAWGSALLGTGGFRPMFEATVVEGGVLGFLWARLGGQHAALDLGVGFMHGGGDGGGLPVAALSVRP